MILKNPISPKTLQFNHSIYSMVASFDFGMLDGGCFVFIIDIDVNYGRITYEHLNLPNIHKYKPNKFLEIFHK